MSSVDRIDQLCKALEVEEKKMRDQILHLNGQIMYNQRLQEVLNQQLRELVAEEETVSSKSKPKLKPKPKSKSKNSTK